MSKFFEYLFLVAKRTFWGADGISKTLGVISLFVVVGFQFTSLPWWARAGLLLVLVFFGTFNVWNDERQVAETAKKQLENIKNKTPNFVVTVGEVKRYTIKPIIERYTNEVQVAQKAVDAKATREAAAETGGAMGIFGMMTQMSSVINNLPGMLRQETTEEKLERLSKHLTKLRAYETKLKHLYKIDLSLTASRSDTNIETWIEASDVAKMIVDDDYARGHIPEMPRNMDYYMHTAVPPLANFRTQDKLYQASEGGTNGAYSKIANLNAQRPLLIFDEDFYIVTDKKMVNLTITNTSQKRNERQQLTVALPLENVPVEVLQENTN
jgi:predicted DNA-binding protein